jgi:hypothetical protein
MRLSIQTGATVPLQVGKLFREWRRTAQRMALRDFWWHPFSSAWLWLVAWLVTPALEYRADLMPASGWVVGGVIWTPWAWLVRSWEMRRLWATW